jgi:hypothetical protein
MLKAIHNEDDHSFAMAEVARLWGAEPGSDAAGELEVWGILVEAYEHALIMRGRLDPVEVIKAEMDMSGRTKADFAAISEHWELPTDLLVADYPVDRSPVSAHGRSTPRDRHDTRAAEIKGA